MSMRKIYIAGALALATAGALPGIASADTRCVNPQTNATTGALVGAAGGAAAGSLLAGRHDRGKGAILGALGGAVLGGVVGNSQTRCPDGYYAYDDRTRQYYDNSGAVYTPQAAYNQGPGGYGPPPPAGAYGPPPPPGGAYDRGPAYGGRGDDFYGSVGSDIRERINFVRDRIQRNVDNRRISPGEAQRSFADLDDISRQEVRLRRRDGGRLNSADYAYLQDRLDRARAILRDQRRNGY